MMFQLSTQTKWYWKYSSQFAYKWRIQYLTNETEWKQKYFGNQSPNRFKYRDLTHFWKWNQNEQQKRKKENLIHEITNLK